MNIKEGQNVYINVIDINLGQLVAKIEPFNIQSEETNGSQKTARSLI